MKMRINLKSTLKSGLNDENFHIVKPKYWEKTQSGNVYQSS